MSIDSETLQTIANFTNSLLGRFESRITNRIKAAFTNSDTDIPSSKLVKDEFTQVRSEIPTKTSDLTNDSGFITEDDVPVKGVKGSAESTYMPASWLYVAQTTIYFILTPFGLVC